MEGVIKEIYQSRIRTRYSLVFRIYNRSVIKIITEYRIKLAFVAR